MTGAIAFRFLLSGAALASTGLLLVLLSNHIRFPLFLEVMEGTVLQHFERASAGLPIYTAPAPEFVALAYNPLYYYVSVPFSWLFGVNLFTLRLVAVLGMAGIAVVLYQALRDSTNSRLWAWTGAGLFAAAYHAMDGYLDSAHADSLMIAAALAGTWRLSRGDRLPALALLAAAFWIKQHGALFALGGFVWVFTRDGWRKSLPGAALLAVLGPGLYLFGGPSLFGSHFHYFTWEVPSAWSELDAESLSRIARLALRSYLPLVVAGAWAFWKSVRTAGIWHVQMFAATLSAVMGALDPGSSNNVFAAFGVFLIYWGVRGFAAAATRPGQIAALAAFFALAYNPLDYWIPAEAAAKHREFTAYVRALPGPVYIPKFGQLADTDLKLNPAVHWVALDDMIRGPGRDEHNHPESRRLLASMIQVEGTAYLIMHNPLEPDPVLGFLARYYRLATDLEDRFRALGNVPHRWGVVWPRYVYQYQPPFKTALRDP
ncbi:MAG: DUF2029 domain-containing protein [Acidobacteria bacterium]|nr:DUF2029 domain-containing protein [Acidobacteriota bacterium]